MIYFDRSYFVAPDGKIAEEAYLTLRKALKKSGKVGIGQIVLANKERIVSLRPCPGFDYKEAKMLYTKLNRLASTSAIFPNLTGYTYKNTVWVKPEVLCEVKFATWTADGKIRHGSYQGLRMDKSAKEVGVERPMNNVTQDKFSVKGVTITNADRIIFPDAGVTKSNLADFYA